MSVFFNGRLWISPATMSMVDDTGMRNRNLTVGNNVAYIGRSEGGEPDTELRFGSPAEAKAVLRSGPLLDAVQRAFDRSQCRDGCPCYRYRNPRESGYSVILDAAENR